MGAMKMASYDEDYQRPATPSWHRSVAADPPLVISLRFGHRQSIHALLASRTPSLTEVVQLADYSPDLSRTKPVHPIDPRYIHGLVQRIHATTRETYLTNGGAPPEQEEP